MSVWLSNKLHPPPPTKQQNPTNKQTRNSPKNKKPKQTELLSAFHKVSLQKGESKHLKWDMI